MIGKRLINTGVAAADAVFTPSEHFETVTYTGNGGTQRIGGYINRGAVFNGSSSNITTPFNISNIVSDINDRTQDFSISLWINPSVIPSSGSDVIFYEGNYNVYSPQYHAILLKFQNGNTVFTVYDGVEYNASTSTVTTNNWHHISCVRESSVLKLYVNGSLADSVTQSGNTSISSSATLKIGQTYSASDHYNGKLDQVRIFNKALSSSEVTTLYGETYADPKKSTTDYFGDNSGVALYQLDGNANDTGGGNGYIGGAAEFNGSSSAIAILGGSFDIATMSISGWFNISDTSQNYQTIFNNYSQTSGQDRGWYVRYETGGNIRIRGFSSSNTQVLDALISTTITQNEWYHIGITISSTEVKVYKNGSQIGTTQSLSSAIGYSGYSAFPTIGAYRSALSSYANYFKGKIDDVRIYSDVLTSTEVGYLYNNTTASIPTDYVAYYKLDNDAKDETGDYNGDPYNISWGYNGTATNVTYQEATKFQPDLVWIKERSSTSGHQLRDSVRGVSNFISSNETSAEVSNTNVTSFDSNGFSLGVSNGTNENTQTYVAWCFKGGGTAVSNTDGSITSSVSANQDAGFSIVEYTNSSGTQTVGHGLSAKPELVITKRTSGTGDWYVQTDIIDGSVDYLVLNSTAAAAADSLSAATASVFSTAYTGTIISYLFHSVDGYSKVGSYTGNGSASGPIVETGFEPAFLMIKEADQANHWNIYDNKRTTENPRDKQLQANLTDAESTNASIQVDFLSNGFQCKGSGGGLNRNNSTFIYMAFAADPDTEAPTVAKSFGVQAYTGINAAQSIDGLGFRPNLVWIKDRDTAGCYHRLIDDVRGLDQIIFSNATNATTTNATNITSFDSDGFTIGTADCVGGANTRDFIAWAWKADDNEPTLFGGPAKAVYKFEDNGNDVTGDNNATATSITYGTGKFNKGAIFNGTTSNFKTGSSFDGTNGGSFTLSCWVKIDDVSSNENILLGRFSYTTSDKQFILRVQNGGTVRLNVYNSSGTGESITTTDTLSIDTWYHIVAVVDSTKKSLYIDGQLSVSEIGSISSNSSATGFLEIGGAGHLPASDAGRLDGMMDQLRIYNGAVSDTGAAALYAETASDNDDLTLGGPPETIISANANAGFSIVKYEGDGTSSARVPHGLSSTPEMIIVKELDGTSSWQVHHTGLSTNNVLLLNSTDAEANPSSDFNNGGLGTVNSTTFGFVSGTTDANNVNESGLGYIAYCFHSVSNFSKFGTYTGNGSSSGPTVTTGFQPDWIMIKRTDGANSWAIVDSVRGGDQELYANLSDADNTFTAISFLSTGFQIVNTANGYNANGSTYIYAAFKIN